MSIYNTHLPSDGVPNFRDREKFSAYEKESELAKFSCPTCGERFRNVAAMRVHRQQEHGYGTYRAVYRPKTRRKVGHRILRLAH